MNNKYLYLFQKDASFRMLCILPVVGVILCLFLIRLNMNQGLELKDIQDKQAIIAQIPALQAKLVQTQVVVNGLTLTLNGIILDKAHPMVVINNTLVKLEGEIGGKKVVTILAHSATLCDAGSGSKCITLLLKQ